MVSHKTANAKLVPVKHLLLIDGNIFYKERCSIA
jgi:hypothetical protein